MTRVLSGSSLDYRLLATAPSTTGSRPAVGAFGADPDPVCIDPGPVRLRRTKHLRRLQLELHTALAERVPVDRLADPAPLLRVPTHHSRPFSV